MSATRSVTVLAVLSLSLLLLHGSATGSPTATRMLAYVSTPDYEVWVVGENGTWRRQVTRGNDSLADFAWSPDGRRLAYLGSGGLYVVNADGSGRRRLRKEFVAIGLAWSPDGRRLAFAGFDEGRSQIFVVDVAGGAPRGVAPRLDGVASPSWSVRGTIAFASTHVDGGPIYAVEADRGRARMLTKGGADSHPSWSPDGRRLLFRRETCPTRTTCGFEINVARADGAMRRRLVHVPCFGCGLSVAWSPNGRQIAFTRPNGDSVANEIVVMDADGRKLRSLTGNLPGGGRDPAWSPDGRRIAYQGLRGISIMNADGSGKRHLVDFGRLPEWQPRP